MDSLRTGKSWDSEAAPLKDIPRAAALIQKRARVYPPPVVVGAKYYAWLALGRHYTQLLINLQNTLEYSLPKFTLRDHLRDCFYGGRS